MPNIPPTALAIGALAILYIVIRIWASRAEERRRMAHDERMARLFAEREEMGPSSIGAVVSSEDEPVIEAGDAGDPGAPQKQVPIATVKIRCRACKALNDESATSCLACGAEL